MKILRIRRGYTTNSSAYTEWLPPPKAPGGPAQPAQGAANPAAPATPGVAPAPTAPAATGPAGTSPAIPTPSPAPVAPAPPPSPATSNGLVLAGLAAALVGVFVVERLVRRLRRRPAPEEGDDE